MVKISIYDTEYEVQVGSIISFPLDDIGKIKNLSYSTSEYTVFATETDTQYDKVYFTVNKIIYRDEPPVEICSEPVEKPIFENADVKFRQALGKLKKSELVSKMTELGLEVPTKAKKSELIQMIVESCS